MNVLFCVLIITLCFFDSSYSGLNITRIENKKKYLKRYVSHHNTFSEPASVSTYTRLPSVVKPIHYKIWLKPNLVTYNIIGDETITIFIEEGTSMIHLNSLNLTIDSISMKDCDNKKYGNLKFEYLKDSEQIKIMFPRIISKESIDLRIKFHGKLSKHPFGFYLSFYRENDDDEDQKVLASTQFEAPYARAAFPCFDEPNFKATFEISLQVHKDLTALSNAEIKGIDKMDDGTKKVNFESTIHMSTYLVAFVVGDIEYIEGITSNGKTRIRVYSVKGQIHRADFALKVGIETVNYLNVYFNMDYPLTKMDMAAIPFFNSGAMENTGLLLYKPYFLLMNRDKKNMFSIASVVAHEIAHQWFGNIVTMNWWNQLWLKEGFATYFEYEVPNIITPFLKPNIYEFKSINAALKGDSIGRAHPMDVPIDDKETLLRIYSYISYEKGGAVIRMLREYVGRDAFRRSLQLYLKRHAYGNTVTEDLWKAFKDTTGVDITYMMDTWSKYEGFPLVMVSQEVQFNKRILKFKQRRFFAGSNQTNDSHMWHIPISIFIVSENATKQLFLMKNKEETFVVEDIDESEILIINPETIGFYRVMYSDDMFNQVLEAIRNGKVSHIAFRGLTHDILSLIDIKELQGEHFVRFINASRYIEDYELHSFIKGIISELRKLILQKLDQNTVDRLNNFVIKIYLPVIEKMGWKDQPGDTKTRLKLRNLLILLLKEAGYNPDEKKSFYDFIRTEINFNELKDIIKNTTLIEEMKEDAYYEKNPFFLGSITKYFEMIQNKDEITLFDLASLLKFYTSPDISDYALMEYISMNKPTFYIKNIFIPSGIYKNALKMAVSRKRNSNNIQQVEKFLETNAGFQTKEAVKEQFKEIDYIDKTTSNSMKYFTSSISNYLNSNKFSTLEM